MTTAISTAVPAVNTLGMARSAAPKGAWETVKEAVVRAAMTVWGYLQAAWAWVANAYTQNPMAFYLLGAGLGVSALIIGIWAACRNKPVAKAEVKQETTANATPTAKAAATQEASKGAPAVAGTDLGQTQQAQLPNPSDIAEFGFDPNGAPIARFGKPDAPWHLVKIEDLGAAPLTLASGVTVNT